MADKRKRLARAVQQQTDLTYQQALILVMEAYAEGRVPLTRAGTEEAGTVQRIVDSYRAEAGGVSR